MRRTEIREEREMVDIVDREFAAADYWVGEPVPWFPKEQVHDFVAGELYSDEPLDSFDLQVSVILEDGSSWKGRFVGDGYSTRNALIHGPSPEILAVVAGGSAFVINVLSPGDYQVVRLCDIRHYRCVPSHDIMLFADDFSVVAIGGRGAVAWVAEEVVGDGFTKFAVEGDTLRVAGYKSGKEVTIAFDLAFGAILK
jgi:hypothetical protein